MFHYLNAIWRNMVFYMILLGSSAAWADESKKTLQGELNDAGKEKKLGSITGNLKTASNDIYDLLLTVAALVGFLIVGYSLYQLYKSSKDEREKPASAIVGLFIGGAMLGISTITVVMRNTVTG
ncbi:hypothetical protein [Parachitinimonas caeni]|uniref:Uncharacterized protein n=1 Tax=Parachitinimonas caeni TaxID=3031301 RepID=A0ABT7DWH3_9NEIS|nr:hypothetical protein [Parachitinimonas caeni]MDK2124413.1 hypothetical protein [Parachitinimonas caeni]